MDKPSLYDQEPYQFVITNSTSAALSVHILSKVFYFDSLLSMNECEWIIEDAERHAGIIEISISNSS